MSEQYTWKETHGIPYDEWLRDHIAINATAESLGNLGGDDDAAARIVGEPQPKANDELVIWGYKLQAKLRYAFADAMLAARTTPNQ